jgi:hypothetical protein
VTWTDYRYLDSRGVGSIKRLGGGGTGFQGQFRILKRAPKKFFPEMLATCGGGGKKIFPSYHTEIARFLPNSFKKLGNFQTKRVSLMLI